MNFRKYFYRDYFEKEFSFVENNQRMRRRVDLSKPDTDNAFKAVKKQNAPVFAAANKEMIDATVSAIQLTSLSHPLNGNHQPETITFTTTYPGLLIGSGYVHETLNEGEFKLGFYFDYTTGMPCIPGSSIKGVLRSVFPQFRNKHPFIKLKREDISEVQQSKVDYLATQLGWENEPDKNQKVHQLEQAIFEGTDLDATPKTPVDGKKEDTVYKSIYQRFCFYNGYISNPAAGSRIFEVDTITPHGTNPLKNPTPLNFLKIRPGVEFTLQLQLQDIEYLSLSKSNIKLLFETILRTTGIGAKTNVGYGQFKP